ncbi:hypothetical protein HCU64_14685 [Methylobacterium sp. C25]|uniref:hypothetical protein n=1 Tax=Methylobacterium sp. C25 TaxID=2721622 RepID=UPI001F209272|nr:hypothetical protein [Methylobacterium sp. C25]MCE4225005.1 hypothetical protein [Methylobacterium sp. C25]
MLFRPIGSSTDAWKWSLTSQARPVGFNKQGFPTSGSEDTQRGARDALVAAWSQEEAFRAEVRADPRFGEMSVYMRGFIENGQPTPAKWSRDPT